LYSAFWPYTPYTLYGYRVVPEEVCMGDVASLRVTRHFDKGSYLIVIDGSWKQVGTDQIVEAPIAEYKKVSDGSKEVDILSPILQEVPEAPGHFQFESDIEIHGRVGVLPRVQEVTQVAEKPTLVLGNSHRECRPQRQEK
jgi:hypothetical protein